MVVEGDRLCGRFWPRGRRTRVHVSIHKLSSDMCAFECYDSVFLDMEVPVHPGETWKGER